MISAVDSQSYSIEKVPHLQQNFPKDLRLHILSLVINGELREYASLSRVCKIFREECDSSSIYLEVRKKIFSDRVKYYNGMLETLFSVPNMFDRLPLVRLPKTDVYEESIQDQVIKKVDSFLKVLERFPIVRLISEENHSCVVFKCTDGFKGVPVPAWLFIFPGNHWDMQYMKNMLNRTFLCYVDKKFAKLNKIESYTTKKDTPKKAVDYLSSQEGLKCSGSVVATNEMISFILHKDS